MYAMTKSIPSLDIANGWSDRETTTRVAKKFTASFHEYFTSRTDKVKETQRIALKKGSKKAFSYFTKEFEILMSPFLIISKDVINIKKRKTCYMYYSSPLNDRRIFLEILEVSERKIHKLQPSVVSACFDSHFISSCMRRLRIKKLTDLNEVLFELTPMFSAELQLTKENKGRYILLKKGLGYLVFDIISEQNGVILYKFITLITENLYKNSQITTSERIFSDAPDNHLALIEYDKLVEDADWDNIKIEFVEDMNISPKKPDFTPTISQKL
jgi:hypothetical protein